MSGQVSQPGEELAQIKARLERLETIVAHGTERESLGKTVKELLSEIFNKQKTLPRLIGYDVWSVILVKEEGGTSMQVGVCAGGSDYSKINELPPEDVSSLASALSHPARITVIQEAAKSSQYASDLEKKTSSKYGALYHHINSLVEANLISQEKERGKYVATPAGKAALIFLNVLGAIIDSLRYEKPSEADTKTPRTVET